MQPHMFRTLLFPYLSADDLCNLRLVNSNYQEMVDDAEYWEERCSRECLTKYLSRKKNSWIAYYRAFFVPRSIGMCIGGKHYPVEHFKINDLDKMAEKSKWTYIMGVDQKMNILFDSRFNKQYVQPLTNIYHIIYYEEPNKKMKPLDIALGELYLGAMIQVKNKCGRILTSHTKRHPWRPLDNVDRPFYEARHLWFIMSHKPEIK